MTTKLAFNEFTRFPHHTFLWEGIDGTRVLTHMLPEGTYNGPMTPPLDQACRAQLPGARHLRGGPDPLRRG